MTNPKPKDKKKVPLNLSRENLIKYGLLLLFAALLDVAVVLGKELSLELVTGIYFIVALLLVIMYKDFVRYKP